MTSAPAAAAPEGPVQAPLASGDGGGATVSPPWEFSQSVRTAMGTVGARPVSVTEFLRALLTTHADEGRAWGEAARAWPVPDFSQTADQWLRQLEPLVSRTGTLFLRLATAILCLVDPDVARAAERSGVLWDVASRIRPDAGEFLTSAGLRLLQRRAPVTAFGLDLLPAAVDLKGRPGEGAATSLAVAGQAQAPAGTIADWAAAFPGGLNMGRGSTSSRVAEHEPVAALGWSRGGRLHVVRSGSQGVGLLRIDPRSQQQVPQPDWPTAAHAAVTDGFIALVQDDGRMVHWGVTDSGGPLPVPTTGVATPIAGITVAGEEIAVVDGHGQLSVGGKGRQWVKRGDALRGAVLSSTPEDVLVGGPNGIVQLYPWDATRETTRQVQALGSEPVRHLAGGGPFTVIAGTSEVAVLAHGTLVARRGMPAAVTAVAVSTDGTAVAVATDAPDVRIWRVDTRADLRLTSYTPDAPEGSDLLGIDPLVDALTALVSARAVAPPLSVGLFGVWGSGKSFFMRRLEAGVEELGQEARRSRRPQSSLWAWRNIRQIRFNAWHYASADVWAGMIEQLISGLSRPTEGRLRLPEELEDLQRRRLERLTGAVAADAAAGTAVVTAQEYLERAKQQVADRQLEEQNAAAAVARARLEAARAPLPEPEDAAAAAQPAPATPAPSPAAATGTTPPAGTTAAAGTTADTGTTAATETTATTGAAAGTGAAGGAGAIPLVDVAKLTGSAEQVTLAAAAARRSVASVRSLLPGERWRIICAILVGPLVALVVGAIVYAVEPSATDAAAMITWLAATATALAGWLTRSAGLIDRKVAAIDAAEAAALKTLAEAQEEVRQAELAAAEAAEKVSAAELEAQKAANGLAAAQRRAAADGPGDLLVEYLEGRRTSEDYRSQLGLIGTVREDLELISDAVTQHNEELPDDDVVNRVVLYVDDLDRCPPDVVVKVLEAVHLLLSYPLFVVVVAVDPHWVSKSLATVYPTLLSGSDVTPDNYLEKIFQLPLWLDPPSADAATAMALALVGSPDGDADGGPRAGPRQEDERRPPGVPVPRAAPEAGGGAQATVRQERATSPPESVVVHEDERLALGHLAPLLRRSPRALKRYLNTYRLIKAVISSGELAPARFLLAVTIGRPDLGEDLVETVKASPDEATLGSIVDQAPVTRAWVQEAVPTVLEWRDYRSGDLKSLIPQVQRFVFRASDLPEKEPLAVLLRRTDDLLVDGQA